VEPDHTLSLDVKTMYHRNVSMYIPFKVGLIDYRILI